MWLARDANGGLYLYKERPIKVNNGWCTIRPFEFICGIDSNLFPEVKWSDEEPRELVLKPIKEKQP